MILIDWGSSAFRAWWLDGAGAVRAERTAALGVSKVQPGQFPAILERQIGDWAADDSGPILAGGMVGSRQGWVEMPYLDCPADLGRLAAHLQAVPWRPGRPVWLCPGLSCRDVSGVPDVMRGEEMQILGAAPEGADACLCLPGSHSKAAWLRDGRVERFTTAFTGELYALLRAQGLLASVMMAADAAFDEPSFAAGLARSGEPGGLLHHLFGVRTRALMAEISAAAAPDYLSGILIGHELRAVAWSPPVIVVGATALTARYQKAFAFLGLAAEAGPADAARRGLLRIARQIKAAP